MKLFSVVVTFNGMKWIGDCLASLFQSTVPIEVIVVDNNSTDETVKYIKSNFPEVILFEQKENLGFGKANNIGMSYALNQNAEFVFLLNQDAKIERTTIEALIQVSKKNKDLGVLSPIHLNWEGDGLEFGFFNNEFFKDFLLSNQLKKFYIEPKFINASAWLLPIKTLKIVGGFDPIFFHYGEDVNYCQRVVYHNLKLAVVPNVKIFHDTTNNGVVKYSSKQINVAISDRYFRNQAIIKYANVNTDDVLNYSKFKRKILFRVIFNFLNFNIEKAKTDLRYYGMLKKMNVKESYQMNREAKQSYL
ncbi:glycosyltransferase family 2 protein [Flavobacterium praedii]|uniref:glycosyltransferase family 2 protein n=1 Tax=Flavobacterium praedii TaxID=3002900 RepID=UPI0024820C96|nr:glycosyltransferase family 2 protein [Flavobacterium praedii]